MHVRETHGDCRTLHGIKTAVKYNGNRLQQRQPGLQTLQNQHLAVDAKYDLVSFSKFEINVRQMYVVNSSEAEAITHGKKIKKGK
jgi:hypothetical protein